METALDIYGAPILLLLLFVMGTVIGSFLNVVIYRLPAGMSIVSPPSSCPACGTKLKWWQLIPVFSYLLQGGKCVDCGERISFQYIVVELVTGLLFVVLFMIHGYQWLTLVYCALIACLLAIAFIDFRHLIIPDGINAAIFILGLAASLLAVTVPLSQALLGSLLGGGVLWALAVLSRGGMGGGDIKLAFGLGLFTGWQLMLLLLFLASLAGALFGVGQMLLNKKKKRRMIPFGPFLALAGVIVLHWGWDLINFYWSLFSG